MQILSKLTAATVLAGGAAVSAQGVYVSPGSAYFQPGTFGQTFSDGSYVSAGAAAPGVYNDVSYAAQNGGPAANTGYQFQQQQQFGGFGGASFPGGFPGAGGFGGPGAYGPSAPPVAVGGTQNFQPPPPPTYVGGTNAPSDSNGPPPVVTIGPNVHTGGFKHKRSVESAKQFPYGGWGGYSGYTGYSGFGGYGNYYNNWYSGPTVTIGQPTAYFAPGTFGQTFSDGSYVSAGVPRPFKKLSKRQATVLQSPFGGPTVTIGAPTAYFQPGTFGQTFSDGSYVSAGVPLAAQIPSYSSYYPSAYPSTYYKREVSTPKVGGVEGLNVDGSRSNARPVQTAYGKQPWTIPLPSQRPDLIVNSNGFSKGYSSSRHDNN